MKTELGINSLLDKFIEDQEPLSSNQNHYYYALQLFFKWVEANGYDWKTLQRHHIIKFKDALYYEKVDNLTFFYHLFFLKIFFKWLDNKGICKNLMEGIKLPKLKDTFPKTAFSKDLDSSNY